MIPRDCLLSTSMLVILACGPREGSSDTGGNTDSSTDTTLETESHGTRGDTDTQGQSTAVTGSTSGVTTTAATEGEGGCAPNVPCDGPSYCDFIMNTCGTDPMDVPVCAPVPDGCPKDLAPVCGCDGMIHDSECFAASVGVDVDAANGCEPPANTFPCGFKFCHVSEYCQASPSDALPSPDGYVCLPLPDGCGDLPSCDCLVDEPCADFGCDMVEGGGLRLTCPGG